MTVLAKSVPAWLSSVFIASVTCLAFGFALSGASQPALGQGAEADLATGKTVVIVLDDSGSMNKVMRGEKQSRMAVARQALLRVIETLPAGTQLGIMLLNGAVPQEGWVLPLSPLDVRLAKEKVSQTIANGGTPLGASLQRAMDKLIQLRAEQPFGDYRLLVVTDGEATDAELLKAYLPMLVSKGVLLDVIGVDMQADHSLANRSHSYRRANDAASFEKALQEIFAESSVDANTGGDGDGFSLIAGLPEGMAEQVLKTLRETGQELIADSQDSSDAHTENSYSSHGNANSSGGVVRQGENRNPAGGWRSSWSFIIICFIVIFGILKGVLGSSRK
jgi:uncharacterized protein YegL